MAITFAVRGDSLDARYSSAGKAPGLYIQSAGTGPATQVDATAIGGNSLNFKPTGTAVKGAIYPGRENWTSNNSFSLVFRVKPNYSGAPVNLMPLFSCGGPSDNIGGTVEFYHHTNGKFALRIKSENNGIPVNFLAGGGSAATWSPVSGTWYDIVLTYDATLTTGAAKIYVDTTLHTTLDAAATYNNAVYNSLNRNRLLCASIALGFTDSAVVPGFDLNEFAVDDTVINPSSVTLTSGSGSLNGASRTAFMDVAAFDGQNSTNPGAANVRASTAYTIYGVAYTGTLNLPAEADVKTGVQYDGATKTGTYTGADRWTDPGEANVRDGTAYKADSTTNNKTGTLDLPAEADVRDGTDYDGATKAGTLDLPAESNVVAGVQYDNATKEGTYTPPTPDYPAEEDVRFGVDYDSGTLTGTLDLPAESDVASGVQYDNGTKEGTRNLVTNVIYQGTLTGNYTTGILRTED